MRIREKPLLSERTTLRLGGTAIAEIIPENDDDCLSLGEAVLKTGGTPHILGGGSNLVVRDGELPVVIIRPSLAGRSADHSLPIPVEETEEGVLVRAGAGMPLPRLLAWCAKNGLSGLEGLAGIPGQVGGAVAMNAGAFGCSTAPLVRKLEVYTPERGAHTLTDASEWDFSYRHFALREECSWFLVRSADLLFKKTSPEQVRKTMKEDLARKTASQPVRYATAGCIFKNPPGDHAGRLLEAAGAKGMRKGAFYFSLLHANFLVHDTKSGVPGVFDDAMFLITEAQRMVNERFGIMLETEVIIWP